MIKNNSIGAITLIFVLFSLFGSNDLIYSQSVDTGKSNDKSTNQYILFHESNPKNSDESQIKLEKVVSRFLALMIETDGEQNQTEKLIVFISPEFFQNNNMTPQDYKVNSYSPKNFEILASNRNYVCAKIYDLKNYWAHLLLFRLVVENGKIYIYPEITGYENYIDPWYDVISYIDKSMANRYYFKKEKYILKVKYKNQSY